MEAQLHFLPLFIPTSYLLQLTIIPYTIIPTKWSVLMSVYLPHSGCHPHLLPHQHPCILPYLNSPYPPIQNSPRSLPTNFPPPLPQVPCPLIPNPLHSVISSPTTSLVHLMVKVHLPHPGSLVPLTLNPFHRTMTMTQKSWQSKILLLLKSGRCTQDTRRPYLTRREWRTYPGG